MKTDTSKITLPILIVFGIIGLWRPKWISPNIYKYYSIFIIFTFPFLLTLTMLINLIFLKDKEQLTDSMYMTLTQLALFLKICNFCARNRSIQSLLTTVQSFELENSREETIYQKKIRFYFRILVINYFFTNWSHVMLQLRALSSSVYVDAFPAWYPFEPEEFSFVKYWTIYFHQFVGILLTSNSNVTIEMYPNFMLYMVSSQMDILCDRLKNIGYQKQKVDYSNKKNQMGIDQRETLFILKKCVKTHQDILV